VTRGQPAEAIDALRRALEVDPDQGRAGPVLVKLLRDANRNDEALRAARAALRIDPYDPALHSVTSELWEAQGAPRRAAFHREAAGSLSRRRLSR
jgi:tetratricopeptide (TPR) repeat protein